MNANQYWLETVVTKTNESKFSCMWCSNADIEFIAVILPRTFIHSALAQAMVYARESESLKDIIQVGLAFICDIKMDKDCSFIVPVFYGRQDHIGILDQIEVTMRESPHEMVNIIKGIQRSKPHRESLAGLVAAKRESDFNDVFRLPLRRAGAGQHGSMLEGDVKVGHVQTYWYTEPESDFALNRGLLWKMWAKSLLPKLR